MTNETNFDAIDLSGAAPAKEPERQYYYMKKAREILAAKEAELGRKNAGLHQDLWLSDECARFGKITWNST